MNFWSSSSFKVQERVHRSGRAHSEPKLRDGREFGILSCFKAASSGHLQIFICRSTPCACIEPLIKFKPSHLNGLNSCTILKRHILKLLLKKAYIKTPMSHCKMIYLRMIVWKLEIWLLVVLNYIDAYEIISMTDIFTCINTHIKGTYLAFFGIFMLLEMSVSKLLFHRRLWYIRTTKGW